jgi:hypothetical protein
VLNDTSSLLSSEDAPPPGGPGALGLQLLARLD